MTARADPSLPQPAGDSAAAAALIRRGGSVPPLVAVDSVAEWAGPSPRAAATQRRPRRSGPDRASPAAPAPARPKWPVGSALALGLVSLLVLVLGFGGWAIMSRISGAVVAPGQVEVERHRQVVQHPDGGVVDRILVREGQRVAAGDPLITLDGQLLQTELAIVEGQYFEILARRGRLEAERDEAPSPVFPDDLRRSAETRPDLQSLIDGQLGLFAARRDTLRQSLDQLEKQAEQVAQQIEGIDAQAAAVERQRGLIERELADQQSLLDRGLAQASRVLALEREAASLDGRLGELTAARAQGETRLTEIGITRLQQVAERRESAETELGDLGYRELELAERRRSLSDQIARLEIRAPVSGVVHEMQVTTPRSVIRPADPILHLVPQDRPLVVAARISPIHVDEVRAGQDVTLRLSAFSSRTTPEIRGQLQQISPDAVVDPATQVPYFRAEVTIPRAELDRLGDLDLVPGMPVEVFVQTGERSPMAYLLQPLTDYFARAFRES
ncbi:HlyD family type I secretion periplasmic adaptor subunit [uncultured Paracoccus sp.]|uniref:HlyD family type I secretion periplasmic adaptor subunit n=1 Tax=uncultured Paracoccus sp. TaxID=189685 RepID=UPI00261BFBA6|nr:HlyD family type I secretion periplasmic adaptor subunit [uncultured Paracoccus sp.]